MARVQRRPSVIEQRTSQALNQLGKDWAALTWNQDRTKVGPLPIVAWNMLTVCAVGVLMWLGVLPRLWLICAFVLFLLWTVARAAAVMPRRRKALQDIYAAIRERAGLPRGTATNPPRPEGYLSVARWGKRSRPADFTITLSPDAKAALAHPFHQLAEKAVQKSVPTPESGQEWVFDWADETHMRCYAVAREHPEVFIRNHDRKMVNALCDKALFDGARNAETHDYALTVEDRKESERAGTTYHFPTKVRFHYGGFDADDPLFRERVTSTFDAKIPGPGVWIYDWTTEAELGCELVDDTDVRARRKKELSKIIADCYTLMGNKRGMRLDVEVIKWMPDGKAHPAHFPTRLRIDFGTLNLGDRRDRDTFEQRFDTAMQARYKGLVWLYDWQPGASTLLDVMAVPESSKKARRKDTERTLRNVIESKFGTAKNFVDCDILQWQPHLTDDGTALVQTAEVKFGAIDVTSNDMRDRFQGHWDSLTTNNDWHYAWDSAKGTVTITAVPPIPDAIQFPEPGSAEFDEAIERAKKGILRFGPQKGGGWLEWDMNDTPHGLVGGKTGSGKALDCATAIITPSGWRTLGDLTVGDTIFDENGNPTTVTGVYDQPLADTCFEVTFSDGSTIVSDDQHLWWTEDYATRTASRIPQPPITVLPLSAHTLDVLQHAAAAARPEDTISLCEVARLTGLNDSEMEPVRQLAASIGPAEEVRYDQRCHRYTAPMVMQRQRVREYQPVALANHVVQLCRSPHTHPDLHDHSTALMAAAVHYSNSGRAGVSSHDLAQLVGVPHQRVDAWLGDTDGAVPSQLVDRLAPLTTPQTTSSHRATVPLYPKQALLETIIDYGRGQRHNAEHLGQVRTLNAIRHSLYTDSGHLNHTVPATKPLRYPQRSLPVKPYTLGVWLGSATATPGTIVSDDLGVIDAVSADGYVVSRRLPHSHGGQGCSYDIAGLAATLSQLGLGDPATAHAGSKFIPDQYLRSSQSQRRSLLAGLCDSGATVTDTGAIQFDCIDKPLARSLVELTRSLGYRPTMSRISMRTTPATFGWRVEFSTSDTVFRLCGKHTAHHTGTVTDGVRAERAIVAVEKTSPRPMRCISVDSPTRQFLAGEAMIPTHNSVALSIVLFYAMYLPDLYEVIVCDPKMMDFIWTSEFPNITTVATTDVELCDACSTARQELEKRQELLKRVQVRKLSMMREMYRDNPALADTFGPVPKRLILFFDEIADFLAAGSDEDTEELKKTARADLEKIGRLGRAMEVNIVAAAQKPDAKIVSTQLRSQLGFRLGVGPLDQYESEQILNSNHGTRFPTSGTPKGRAWGYDPKNGYRQVQIMFLPDDSMTAEWDPTQTLLGTKDRIRTRLTDLGFQRIQITNTAGGQEPRWVTVDDDTTPPSGSAPENPEDTTTLPDDADGHTPPPQKPDTALTSSSP